MSIPVFELIGPPGSGKSSLLSCIINSRRLNSRPVISVPAIAIKQPRKYFRRFQNLSFSLSNKSCVLDKVFLTTDDISQYDSLNMRSDENLSNFFDYSLGLIVSQQCSWLRKSLVAKWWVESCHARIKLECSNNKELLCLDDEPLSYRLSLFNDLACESTISKYYELMPLPSGVVHIEIGEEELLQRLKSRRRVAVRHRGLSKADLITDIVFSISVAKSAKDMLENRGVPILKLDGSDTLKSNAKRVINFMTNTVCNF